MFLRESLHFSSLQSTQQAKNQGPSDGQKSCPCGGYIYGMEPTNRLLWDGLTRECNFYSTLEHIYIRIGHLIKWGPRVSALREDWSITSVLLNTVEKMISIRIHREDRPIINFQQSSVPMSSGYGESDCVVDEAGSGSRHNLIDF